MDDAKGFSLIELLLALAVTLLLGTMTFQLFHQNERVVRDQTLIAEMQQTARTVASQIADEVRMAGQGVPTYAAQFDAAPSEAVTIFLNSSSASRIDFRAGLSNVETTTAAGESRDFTIGASRTLSVLSSGGFSSGKFIYISGRTDAAWTWVRAELKAVSSNALTLMPTNAGVPDATIHFASPPTVELEEAVSISLTNGTVRRATATNMSDLSSPAWSPANEIGRNCTALTLTYYDANGDVVQPTFLANRIAIARVDIRLTVETASRLSNGTRPSFSLTLKTIPRNGRLRPGPM
jgi:prepilin-type N-terminal cleavage/methylation domain-containing protein